MRTNIQQPTAKNTCNITYKSADKKLVKVPKYFESTNWYKKSDLPTPECEKNKFFTKIKERKAYMQQHGLLTVPKSELNPHIQRGLDLCFASILSIPCAISTFMAAALTKATQPEQPAFHKQCRYGQDGEKISIIKIRTVEKTENGWRKSSQFARFLRKYSIDEFPQLLNVFKGNMSFMGPRTIIFKDIKTLMEEGGEDYVAQRLSYKPGFGFGYEKDRMLRKPRIEMEKEFFENHGIKTYFETLFALAKTILKGNNK